MNIVSACKKNLLILPENILGFTEFLRAWKVILDNLIYYVFTKFHIQCKITK